MHSAAAVFVFVLCVRACMCVWTGWRSAPRGAGVAARANSVAERGTRGARQRPRPQHRLLRDVSQRRRIPACMGAKGGWNPSGRGMCACGAPAGAILVQHGRGCGRRITDTRRRSARASVPAAMIADAGRLTVQARSATRTRHPPRCRALHAAHADGAVQRGQSGAAVARPLGVVHRLRRMLAVGGASRRPADAAGRRRRIDDRRRCGVRH